MIGAFINKLCKSVSSFVVYSLQLSHQSVHTCLLNQMRDLLLQMQGSLRACIDGSAKLVRLVSQLARAQQTAHGAEGPHIISR